MSSSGAWRDWLELNDVDLREADFDTVWAENLPDMQARLYEAGAGFVHLSPSVERHYEAKRRFGLKGDHDWSLNVGLGATAHFMICIMQGAAAEHVPVMFLDGDPREFRDQRALREAFCIPAQVGHRTPIVYAVYR